MIETIRRVVTGHDENGRSIIVSDGPAPLVLESPHWPGSGTTTAWSTNEAPASNGDEMLGKPVTDFPVAGTGGVSFMIMHIPPISDLERMTPEQRAEATRPIPEILPAAMAVDNSKSYAMHTTDTLDLIVMLKGEITMMVDDGEVTLKPFDTLVQRGVNHGWENRGTETALVAAAVIDARPLGPRRDGMNHGS